MIAAVYTAVSLALSLASFGVVQIRVAECLTLLPVLSPLGIYGVTVGCLLTNLVGAVMGLTMPVDILFGTLATAIAAALSYFLAKRSDQKIWQFPLPYLQFSSMG